MFFPFPTHSVDDQCDALHCGTVTRDGIGQIGTCNRHASFVTVTALYYDAWFVRNALRHYYPCYSQPFDVCLDYCE